MTGEGQTRPVRFAQRPSAKPVFSPSPSTGSSTRRRAWLSNLWRQFFCFFVLGTFDLARIDGAGPCESIGAGDGTRSTMGTDGLVDWLFESYHRRRFNLPEARYGGVFFTRM